MLSACDADGTPYTLELCDWAARIVQHEMDHLDGILIVDRMYPRSLRHDAVARTAMGRAALPPDWDQLAPALPLATTAGR